MANECQSTASDPVDENFHNDELQTLANQIRERDRISDESRSHWLLNGRDLLAAKAITRHGEFEAWCAEQLNYSKRTAEKLMRAAEAFEPLIKNAPGSVLPLASLAYALSAPSVPQEIRDAYAPRIIAGDPVGSELRGAIKAHREKIKKAEQRKARQASKSAEAQDVQAKRAQARSRREARIAAKRQTEVEQRAAARSEALTLIHSRFGDELPTLLALAAEAGPGTVLGHELERELQARAQAAATPDGDAIRLGEGASKVAGAEVITDPAASVDGQPTSAAPMDAVCKGDVAEPVLNEPATTDIVSSTSSVSPRAGNSKFGDLGLVVSTFPAAQRQ